MGQPHIKQYIVGKLNPCAMTEKKYFEVNSTRRIFD